MTRLTALVLLLCVLGGVTGSFQSPVQASTPASYAGRCVGTDATTGTTVVVDFQQLDGNGGTAAPTLVRCAPAPVPFASRTGLQAMKDAGITPTGVVRWGEAFVCRIDGRPSLDEAIPVTDQPSYSEECLDTPPAAAYWSYWHADGTGEDWEYSSFGATGRDAIPGGFEGWSFSLNASGDSNPVPRFEPINPDLDPVDPTDPTGPVDPGNPGDPGPTDPAVPANGTPAARSTAGWLIRELHDGTMPAPIPTALQPTDWGLTIDTLWALYAAGTGADAAAQVLRRVEDQAGDYLGVKLFKDTHVRLAGQTAKLLVAAVVGGKNPHAFGRVMRADGSVTDRRYDIRAETLDLIQTSGPSAGRISDRGTAIDNTNTFSQALAVIGLARSGGVPASAVSYLVKQQCAAGYFRMFDHTARTCDADHDSADGDGTAIGLQALMTARAHGVAGLDPVIARGVRWLLGAQHADGSFSGGVATPGSNTNSTGLIAQTLYAVGKKTAAARARAFVRSLLVTPARAKDGLAGEAGAIAYDRTSFAKARSHGITGRDQWRRASAQAIFALAPVSFADLGSARPTGNPTPPTAPPTPRGAAPGNGSVVTPPVSAAVPASSSPAGRLGSYLAGRLVNGDHVEVRSAGTSYVDYDLTADVVLALRVLREQPAAAARASTFLLAPASVAAYAAGAPYDAKGAAYAAPLAKLILVARSSADKQSRWATRLRDQLAALEDASGRFTDTGRYADPSSLAGRQAWIVLALQASGDSAAAAKAATLVSGGACADGLVPAQVGKPCDHGDLGATGLIAQAVNAVEGAGATDRRTAVTDLVRSLAAAPTTGAPVSELASAAGGRQAGGLDTSTTATALVRWQRKDGGLPAMPGEARSDLASAALAAPALVERSWLALPGAGLAPMFTVAAIPDPAPLRTSPHRAPDTSHTVLGLSLAAGAFAALSLVLGLLLVRARRSPPAEGASR